MAELIFSIRILIAEIHAAGLIVAEVRAARDLKVGKMIRMFVKGISVIGRNTGGVRLMKLEEKEKVVAVEKVPAESGNGNGNGGTMSAPATPPGRQHAESEKKKPEPPIEPIIFA